MKLYHYMGNSHGLPKFLCKLGNNAWLARDCLLLMPLLVSSCDNETENAWLLCELVLSTSLATYMYHFVCSAGETSSFRLMNPLEIVKWFIRLYFQLSNALYSLYQFQEENIPKLNAELFKDNHGNIRHKCKKGLQHFLVDLP